MRLGVLYRFFYRNCLKYQQHNYCKNNNKNTYGLNKLQLIKSPARYFHDDNEDEEFMEYINRFRNDEQARYILYKTIKKDTLFERITECVSIQETLNVFENNRKDFQSKHYMQMVFVLKDLKSIFDDIHNLTDNSTEFIENLLENETFQKFLNEITLKLNIFDLETLSYLLLYLYKLEIPMKMDISNQIIWKLEQLFSRQFTINASAKYLEAIYKTSTLKSYYLSQFLVPKVFDFISKCKSVEDLKNLSISLNKLHNFMRDEQIVEYCKLVVELQKLLKPNDYKTILEIIKLLNYPHWRYKNVPLISDCILLLRNHLNHLSAKDLIILYEIFFKIQEPATILSELQHSASRLLQQTDLDAISLEKLKLFSSLIYFTSPVARINFHMDMGKFIVQTGDLNQLFVLRKILSYLKISDTKLCEMFWTKMIEIHEKNLSEKTYLPKLCQQYINFNIDIPDYRHEKFEQMILEELKLLFDNPLIFPKILADVMGFLLIYSNDYDLLDKSIGYFDENWRQFDVYDCLKIAYALKLFTNTGHKYLKYKYVNQLNHLLNRVLEYRSDELNISRNSIILRACIYKQHSSKNFLFKLIGNYENFTEFTSKSIESIAFICLSTNAFLPGLIDKLVDYVVEADEKIIGFNLEKILYLCYHLGYSPKNADNFFRVATNIILRDQHRLTSLSFLQSALALTFFQKLPNSMIKLIFNTEFLDRLDAELVHCYSKDRYPQRVRNNMFQLNRAVCLGYPESNVPWFHQKYTEDIIRKDALKTRVFHNRVKESLEKLIVKPVRLVENVIAPYGYYIDFVIVDGDKKSAILLLRQTSYTEITRQLIGKYQLKKRHLEMFGYQVYLINYVDWIDLYQNSEREEFLLKLINDVR